MLPTLLTFTPLLFTALSHMLYPSLFPHSTFILHLLEQATSHRPPLTAQLLTIYLGVIELVMCVGVYRKVAGVRWAYAGVLLGLEAGAVGGEAVGGVWMVKAGAVILAGM
jgi:hypothetical protein